MDKEDGVRFLKCIVCGVLAVAAMAAASAFAAATASTTAKGAGGSSSAPARKWADGGRASSAAGGSDARRQGNLVGAGKRGVENYGRGAKNDGNDGTNKPDPGKLVDALTDQSKKDDIARANNAAKKAGYRDYDDFAQQMQDSAKDLGISQADYRRAEQQYKTSFEHESKARNDLLDAKATKTKIDGQATQMKTQAAAHTKDSYIAKYHQDVCEKKAASLRKEAAALKKTGNYDDTVKAYKLEGQASQMDKTAASYDAEYRNLQNKAAECTKKYEDLTIQSKKQDGIIAEKADIANKATKTRTTREAQLTEKGKIVDAKKGKLSEMTKSPLAQNFKSTLTKTLETTGQVLNIISNGSDLRDLQEALHSQDPDKIADAMANAAVNKLDKTGIIGTYKNVGDAAEQSKKTSFTQEALDNTNMKDGQRAAIIQYLHTPKERPSDDKSGAIWDKLGPGMGMSLEDATTLADEYMNGSEEAKAKLEAAFNKNDRTIPERETTKSDIGYYEWTKNGVKEMGKGIAEQFDKTKDFVKDTVKDSKELIGGDKLLTNPTEAAKEQFLTTKQVFENQIKSGNLSLENIGDGIMFGLDKQMEIQKKLLVDPASKMFDKVMSWFGSDSATLERKKIIDSLVKQGATQSEAEEAAWKYQLDKMNNPDSMSTALADLKSSLKEQGRLVDKETGEKVSNDNGEAGKKADGENGDKKSTEGDKKMGEGDKKTTEGDPKTTEGDQKTTEGDPKTTDGEQKTTEGDQKTTEGDQKTTEGDQKTTEGDPKTTEGDPKTTEGDNTQAGEEEKKTGDNENKQSSGGERHKPKPKDPKEPKEPQEPKNPEGDNETDKETDNEKGNSDLRTSEGQSPADPNGEGSRIPEGPAGPSFSGFFEKWLTDQGQKFLADNNLNQYTWKEYEQAMQNAIAQQNAQQTINQGGAAANQISTESANATANAQQENSWGKHLSDAVQQSITAGLTSLGTSFANVAGESVANELLKGIEGKNAHGDSGSGGGDSGSGGGEGSSGASGGEGGGESGGSGASGESSGSESSGDSGEHGESGGHGGGDSGESGSSDGNSGHGGDSDLDPDFGDPDDSNLSDPSSDGGGNHKGGSGVKKNGGTKKGGDSTTSSDPHGSKKCVKCGKLKTSLEWSTKDVGWVCYTCLGRNPEKKDDDKNKTIASTPKKDNTSSNKKSTLVWPKEQFQCDGCGKMVVEQDAFRGEIGGGTFCKSCYYGGTGKKAQTGQWTRSGQYGIYTCGGCGKKTNDIINTASADTDGAFFCSRECQSKWFADKKKK